MATLLIEKNSLNVWTHTPSDFQPYILTQFYAKANGDNFIVFEFSGVQRGSYHYSDISIKDGANPLETGFVSIKQVMLRLEELKYVGFEFDGDFIAAEVISSDPSNALTEGTDGLLFVQEVPDATTTVKGKIRLSGDFDPTSTADNPVITDASTTSRGVVTTSDQRFKGVKSFSDAVLIGTDTHNGVDKLQVNGSGLFIDGVRYNKGISVSGIDLNTLTVAGFYNGNILVNAPDTGYFHITVESDANPDWIHQTLTSFGFGNTGHKIYSRTREAGTWTPWVEILKADTVGKVLKTRKDITGTSYTLLSSDVDKILYTTNASPVTITVPSGLTINQEYEVIQYGDGLVSYITSGTTLCYQDYEIATHYSKYSRITITYIDTETYQLLGQLKMI